MHAIHFILAFLVLQAGKVSTAGSTSVVTSTPSTGTLVSPLPTDRPIPPSEAAGLKADALPETGGPAELYAWPYGYFGHVQADRPNTIMAPTGSQLVPGAAEGGTELGDLREAQAELTTKGMQQNPAMALPMWPADPSRATWPGPYGQFGYPGQVQTPGQNMVVTTPGNILLTSLSTRPSQMVGYNAIMHHLPAVGPEPRGIHNGDGGAAGANTEAGDAAELRAETTAANMLQEQNTGNEPQEQNNNNNNNNNVIQGNGFGNPNAFNPFASMYKAYMDMFFGPGNYNNHVGNGASNTGTGVTHYPDHHYNNPHQQQQINQLFYNMLFNDMFY